MMDHSTVSAALWATAAVATQNARSDVSDELRRTLMLVASTGVLQMIMSAGPEVDALLAAFQEYARRHGTSRELMTHASELTNRWNEMQKADEQRPRLIDNVLTPREISIVELIGRGHSNKEIARRLGIAPETVKAHMKNVFAKLGVEKRAQAVMRAHALGLIGAYASIVGCDAA
jgi:LuxR family maltose regulon positive regulatory protein